MTEDAHSKPIKPMTRRSFLNRCGLALAGLTGLALAPFQAFAAWSSKAFNAATFDEAIEHVFGQMELTPSDKVTLKIANLAENGAQVPVDISTSLENVEKITLLAKDNPRPLLVSFQIPQGTLPEISTRIRLAKSTLVYAVVTANGKHYSTRKSVQVTIGGCGG